MYLCICFSFTKSEVYWLKKICLYDVIWSPTKLNNKLVLRKWCMWHANWLCMVLDWVANRGEMLGIYILCLCSIDIFSFYFRSWYGLNVWCRQVQSNTHGLLCSRVFRFCCNEFYTLVMQNNLCVDINSFARLLFVF